MKTGRQRIMGFAGMLVLVAIEIFIAYGAMPLIVKATLLMAITVIQGAMVAIFFTSLKIGGRFALYLLVSSLLILLSLLVSLAPDALRLRDHKPYAAAGDAGR